jgi:hypothetical protein
MSDEKETNLNWQPDFRHLSSFRIAEPIGESASETAPDPGYCLWGVNGEDHKPAGTVVCINGGNWVCDKSGTWVNQNTPCPNQ